MPAAEVDARVTQDRGKGGRGMQVGPEGDRDVLARNQLAVALLVIAVLNTPGALWPADPDTPVERWVVVATANVVLSAVLLCLPVHPRSTQRVLIAAVLTSGVLAASCHATQGVVVFCLGFVLAGQFATYTLSTRRAAVVVGVVVATILAASVVAPAPVHPVNVATMSAMALLSCALLGRQAQALRRHAGTDHLTGALNRGAFADRMVDAVPRALRTGRPLAVVALDVDDFRLVNDRYGHLGADDLLVELTAAWREELGAGAFLGRVGGDEFVAVLPGRDETEGRRWADRAGGRGPLPCSAGVAELRPDDTVRSLLDRADRDLYDAKAARDHARERVA